MQLMYNMKVIMSSEHRRDINDKRAESQGIHSFRIYILIFNGKYS